MNILFRARAALERVRGFITELDNRALDSEELLGLLESVEDLKLCCRDEPELRTRLHVIEEDLKRGFLDDWKDGPPQRAAVLHKVQDFDTCLKTPPSVSA